MSVPRGGIKPPGVPLPEQNNVMFVGQALVSTGGVVSTIVTTQLQVEERLHESVATAVRRILINTLVNGHVLVTCEVITFVVLTTTRLGSQSVNVAVPSAGGLVEHSCTLSPGQLTICGGIVSVLVIVWL